MFEEFFYLMYTYISKIRTNKTPVWNAYVLICVFQEVNLSNSQILKQ
jgi:hypothetical protein